MAQNILVIQMITKEAVQMFKNSNLFLQNYEEIFAKLATTILSTKEILLLGTAAIIAKNPIVSRRFWSG